MTTTGLNDVIIQKVKGRRAKQPKGTGFVAKFGEDRPVELRYKVLNARNFRVKDNNATLVSKMDINIKFIVMAEDEEKLALDVTQFNSRMYFHIEPQGGGVFNADVDGYTIGRLRVIESNLGQPPPPPSNGTDDTPPPKNFGLKIHAIHRFLTKMKPTVIT